MKNKIGRVYELVIKPEKIRIHRLFILQNQQIVGELKRHEIPAEYYETVSNFLLTPDR